MAETRVAEEVGTTLSPYVPRLFARWLREAPDEHWRQVDATLAFVDVSGFTALSERLARAGNIGAEELTDTIAACFATLLEVAYAAGGSLLKFGGDALLLLFTGEAHPERGARAALGMRTALRAMGRITTSAGAVTLRMSIGLHSGTVHLFSLGGSHRELMIAGPGATETVRMEAVAGAGQIVASPAPAERLPSSLVGAALGPGVLLASGPATGVDDAAARPWRERQVPRFAIPVALRDHLGSGQRDAEHRRVTVAFLRFSGVDELLQRDGGDATAAALDQMVRAAQEGADGHAITFLGSDVDAGGGKVILAAGAPTSEGNDEERMLLALRDIVEHPNPLPFQIGVHAGPVFAGDIGPSYRRAYTVMGDAVNLAARVMSRAAAGQLLATRPVLEASRTTFDTVELSPFAVKGKREPVVAAAVGPVRGSRGTRTIGEVAQLPFVGRQAELASFDAVLAGTATGAGHLVEVVGEAGIGKSRLIAAFKERASDRPVHELVCELHRATTPYASSRRFLRTLLATPTDAPPAEAAEALEEVLHTQLPHLLEWAPLLAIAYGTELPATAATANLDERFLRPRLHTAVLELLATLWTGPVLVVIEDVQWMDEASRDLLWAIGERLDEHPWTLCVSRREQGEAPPPGIPATTLTLEPLDPDTAQELASAATETAPLASHDMAQLVARSAGNPLFLQELVEAAQVAGSVESLPTSIGSLLTARIDRLPTELREVLREVSVLGYSFPKELATAVMGGGDPRRLGDLSALLADEGPIVRFRHAMLRDAAYEGLPYRRRRTLHAIAGDRLAAETVPRPELLSFHYHLAGRYEDAWHASLEAGRRATALYANTEAATFYARALDAGRRLRVLEPAAVASASEAYGDVLLRMGELERAAGAYRVAYRTLRDDPVPWAGVMLKSAQVQAQLQRYSQALGSLTRARRRLEALDDDAARAQRAQLMVWYGHLRMEQGRSTDAISWCRRAIEEAEAVGDRDALAHANRLLDWAYVDQGRPDMAVHSERAIALYEELDDLPNQATVLNNLGGIAYWAGDWTEALGYYERANHLLERVGDVVRAALGRNNIAEILADQGRWDEAADLFRGAERALRAANFRVAIAYVRGNLGRTAAWAGDFEEAAQLLEEARRGAEDAGATTQLVEADARLAELAVLCGEPEVAMERLDRAVRRSDAKEGVAAQEPLLHRVRGYALLQRGASDEAEAAFSRSLEAAHVRNAAYERALAQKALVDLASSTGEEPDGGLQAAMRQTLDALGVERLPAVPLDGLGDRG